MKLYDLNPHIRYARVHKSPFSHKKEISICYDARLFFFENAGGFIEVWGEKYNICDKTAIYLPPLTEYRFFVDYNDETTAVTLNFDLVSEYGEMKACLGTANRRNFDISVAPQYSVAKELSLPIIKSAPEIAANVSKIPENFLTKGSLYRERSSAILKLCLLELVSRDEKYAYSDICKKILAYVRDNYAEATLTNETIAERFNYHPYHVNRIIKSECGRSLRSYIIFCRLEMAKNFLLTTDMSVSEVAFHTGFCSSAHFIKTFREKTGRTPKEYRNVRIHGEM